jgi:hypothetical protein
MATPLSLNGRLQMTSQDMPNFQTEMRIAVQEHWKAFLIEGILSLCWGLER